MSARAGNTDMARFHIVGIHVNDAKVQSPKGGNIGSDHNVGRPRYRFEARSSWTRGMFALNAMATYAERTQRRTAEWLGSLEGSTTDRWQNYRYSGNEAPTRRRKITRAW